MHRQKLKAKELCYVSALQNPGLILEHLNILQHVRGDQIVNFDETNCSSDKYVPTAGRGRGPVRMIQWQINGKTYSAIAAYTTRGWIAWQILTGTVTHVEIMNFIRDKVRPALLPDSVVIFDGASVHTTDDVMTLLDEVTNGRFKRVPPYCHQLSPVERGFANVWNYVRHHYDDAALNPIAALNASFHFYSADGFGGSVAKNHFQVRLFCSVAKNQVRLQCSPAWSPITII